MLHVSSLQSFEKRGSLISAPADSGTSSANEVVFTRSRRDTAILDAGWNVASVLGVQDVELSIVLHKSNVLGNAGFFHLGESVSINWVHHAGVNCSKRNGIFVCARASSFGSFSTVRSVAALEGFGEKALAALSGKLSWDISGCLSSRVGGRRKSGRVGGHESRLR